MNRLLRASAGLFSLVAGLLHWDIWANHGYDSTPVRELMITAAVVGVVLGLLAYVDRQPAALPAAVANLLFLGAFALSRVASLPTFHGGWSESGLAPAGATYFGISTTLLVLLAEALAVACGFASVLFGREAPARALPSEVLRTA
jgi:hypothetical protein